MCINSPDEPDPIDREIERALTSGWTLLPQVAHGTCDNALISLDDGFTDIVTVPTIGYATVVRLRGGPQPGYPRYVGHQMWRHLVPTHLAVEWALTDRGNDEPLAHWRSP